MTLTTTYTVTDRYGDSLEIGAVVGTVEVRDLAGNFLLDLDIDEAFDLEDAIHRAIEDAVEQEAEMVESDEDGDDLDTLPEGWVEIGHTEPGSFFFAPTVDEPLDLGKTFTVPKAATETLTFKVYNPSIGVAPAVADFFD